MNSLLRRLGLLKIEKSSIILCETKLKILRLVLLRSENYYQLENRGQRDIKVSRFSYKGSNYPIRVYVTI